MRDYAHFVLSKKKVIGQYAAVKEFCDKVSYSLKTNAEVGRVLEDLTDCEFSVHTIEDTSQIKDKSRLWLFAQAWDKEEIMELFKQLNNEGVTIIQVTHSEKNAGYGSRIINLLDGMIQNK